jgi:hypothetical protein
MNLLIKLKKYLDILMMKWKIANKVMDGMILRKINKNLKNAIDVGKKDILQDYVRRNKLLDVSIA